MEQQITDTTEPQTKQQTADEQTWAMLCHLSIFASFIVPLGNIFGPLTVWLLKKDVYPLVMDQGKESMNFQISMTIYSIVFFIALIAGLLSTAVDGLDFPLGGGVLSTLMFLFLLLGLGLLNIVFVIIAAVKSSRGQKYRYPLSIRFIS